MTYIVTTVSGQKIDLGAAYSIQINKSKEAPADTLFAIFFSQKIHPEYKLIDVYTSENQLFFSGVVDEQKFEVAENGCFFTIKSRSKAAYLIDNEACAQAFCDCDEGFVAYSMPEAVVYCLEFIHVKQAEHSLFAADNKLFYTALTASAV